MWLEADLLIETHRAFVIGIDIEGQFRDAYLAGVFGDTVEQVICETVTSARLLDVEVANFEAVRTVEHRRTRIDFCCHEADELTGQFSKRLVGRFALGGDPRLVRVGFEAVETEFDFLIQWNVIHEGM